MRREANENREPMIAYDFGVTEDFSTKKNCMVNTKHHAFFRDTIG